MPLKFTRGLSPVYFSVLLFSHAALFFSARSMALASLICCWLVNLSSLFHFPSPLLCFSGLDCFQEPHGVMPDLCLSVCVFYPCYSSYVCVCVSVSSPSLSITTAAFLSELNAPIKCHISISALLLVTTSHILAFISMLRNCVCVTSVFFWHKCNHLFSTHGICVCRDCL